LNVEYPDNKKFSVVLTHDIDDIYIKPRHLLYSFYHFPENKDISFIFNSLMGIINKKKSNYINFNKIIDIEKKYGVTSTFYFLNSLFDIFGIKYNLQELTSEINYILDEECEIGFHTGYHTFNNLDEIVKEKEKMEKLTGKKIIGARNHVLRFKTPDSWNILANAGFKYDTSYGYSDMVGFRNGLCHPFQPYDLNREKLINILEIPLCIQDWTLRMEMRKNFQESWEYIKKLIDITEKYNGVLTVLWHNWTFALPTSIGGIFGREWTTLYEKIIKYADEKKAWITNCSNLYRFYMQNGFILKSN
jgi:peptidoglycan/xylan/chitin deacetylase (PgdA/CDA1 family)